jgi:hypothetical protein
VWRVALRDSRFEALVNGFLGSERSLGSPHDIGSHPYPFWYRQMAVGSKRMAHRELESVVAYDVPAQKPGHLDQEEAPRVLSQCILESRMDCLAGHCPCCRSLRARALSREASSSNPHLANLSLVQRVRSFCHRGQPRDAQHACVV